MPMFLQDAVLVSQIVSAIIIGKGQRLFQNIALSRKYHTSD